jgi:hypothetical protein
VVTDLSSRINLRSSCTEEKGNTMRQLMYRLLLLVLVLVVGSASAALAQQTTGSVQGYVKDSTGGAIPGADVWLINLQTNQMYAQSSNDVGRYIFNAVVPGDYRLKASLAGFNTVETNVFKVPLGRTLTMDVSLEIGEISTVISVEASSFQVDTVSGSVTTMIDTRLIQNLPSVSRSVLDVTAMTPGLSLRQSSDAPDGQVIGFQGYYAETGGNRGSQNTFYVDGSENTGAWRNSSGVITNPDTIKELTVQTNSTSAEYGKQPGAVFNAITKSGTNEFHGSAWYFGRDESLNANNTNNNAAGRDRQKDASRSWGGAVGGPIVNDKTFFFSSFNRYDSSLTGTTTGIRFPTEKMKQGDFSEIPDVGGNAFNLKQAYTGADLGMRITNINPVAQKILDRIPTLPSYGPTTRYTWAWEGPLRNNEFMTRIDHSLTDSQQLSGNYTMTRGDKEEPNHNWANNQFPGWATYYTQSIIDNVSVRHMWALSPTKVIENRFSTVRQNAPRSFKLEGAEGQDHTSLGITGLPQYQQKNMPSIRVSNGFQARYATNDTINQGNFRFSSRMSWISGDHNIRFGGEFQRDLTEITRYDNGTVNFEFDGLMSRFGIWGPNDKNINLTSVGDQAFAYAFADFLQGATSNWSMSGINGTEVRLRSFSFFLQDEWKVTPRLTITPGLRYEYFGPLYSPTMQKIGGAYFPGHQSSQYPEAPLGKGWAGDVGVPKGLLPTDKNNFAPRLGFAWDPRGDGKTAIRGAMGIYYGASVLGQLLNLNSENGFGASGLGGNARRALWPDPVATGKTNVWDATGYYTVGGGTVAPPDPFSERDPSNYPWETRLAKETIRGQAVSVFTGTLRWPDPDYATPYTPQWNATIAHELNSGIVLEVSYIGNRGRKLTTWQPMNYSVWEEGATDSTQSRRDRRIFPQYSNDMRAFSSRLTSSYDAVQLRGTTRMTRLSADVSYVFGKSLSTFGNRATNWDTVFDTGGGATYPERIDLDKALVGPLHTFKAAAVYDLPMFRFNQAAWNSILGGWAISAAFVANSGGWGNVTWGFDANADGFGDDRPRLIGPIQYTQGTKDERRRKFLVDPASSFGNPCAVGTVCSTPGDLGRNAIDLPGSFNLDGALVKTFKIKETTSAQFRVDIRNLTNTSFLQAPNLSFNRGTNVNFGYASGFRHSPRTIQLGMKFNF